MYYIFLKAAFHDESVWCLSKTFFLSGGNIIQIHYMMFPSYRNQSVVVKWLSYNCSGFMEDQPTEKSAFSTMIWSID